LGARVPRSKRRPAIAGAYLIAARARKASACAGLLRLRGRKQHNAPHAASPTQKIGQPLELNGMDIRRFLSKPPHIFLGLLLPVLPLRNARAALSGSTEQIRRMIAERDFPGCEPVMDTQQQFIVFSPDKGLSRELLAAVMKLRQEICHFFGISKVWDQPAFILVFPTRERYGLPSTGGAAVQFKYRGQDVRLIASYLQDELKERILPHEMVHFLIADLSAVGSPRRGKPTELPVFINEGIAEYFTAHPARRLLFEKAVWEIFKAGRLESLRKIVSSAASWPEALSVGPRFWEQRAQAYSVIRFLASLPGGNVKLRNYILSYGTLSSRVSRESASLRAFEMAFRQDYSSWDQLQRRWTQFIRDREIVVIEAESAPVIGSSGEKPDVVTARSEKLWFSGGKAIFFRAAKPGGFLTIQGTMPSTGTYDIYAIYARSPRSGQFRLSLNGKQLPAIFDGYASQNDLCEPVHYGRIPISAGAMTIAFSVVGKQPVSSGFDIGVDCLVFRREFR